MVRVRREELLEGYDYAIFLDAAVLCSIPAIGISVPSCRYSSRLLFFIHLLEPAVLKKELQTPQATIETDSLMERQRHFSKLVHYITPTLTLTVAPGL